MRIDRYTQKMQEALQAAQDLASQLNNSEITNEHFLSALLDQSDGIARPLLEKIGANVDQLQERLRAELERRPKIHGSAADLRISNELRNVLDSAEKEMSKLKDEFTSAEHYLLALAGSNVPAAKLLEEVGVTRDKIMQGLQQVRGSQRVTDQNPEGKYQALEKYGRDLTELARRGKIDPVIGRDNEIRRIMQVLSRRTKNNPVLIGDPRRSGAANHQRRCAGVIKEQTNHRHGHRRHGRGCKVSWRIRRSSQSLLERSDRCAGTDHPVHRRTAHHRW